MGGAMGAAAPDESKRKADPGCVSCHAGIEIMHPWDPLSCTDCHGGDGEAREKERAHVQPRQAIPNDERTVGLNVDPEYRRFVNPTDLRVVEKTCARCHSDECANVPKSLHGTTAGPPVGRPVRKRRHPRRQEALRDLPDQGRRRHRFRNTATNTCRRFRGP